MARPLRLEFPGALWHITSRGNEKRPIFTDEADREEMLGILGRTVRRCRWRLHAYVLMGNHYHLLLETPEPNLSDGMHDLNGLYTQRFNRRHDRVGHLFQGRFKGILVERESHLLEVTRYVVLNPVRAGLVEAAASWTWSNYLATAGARTPPPWLETGWTLRQFDVDRAAAQRKYRRFVAAGERGGKSPWGQLEAQIFLGGPTFRARVAARIRQIPVGEDIPRCQLRVGRPPLAWIVLAVGAAGTSIPPRDRRILIAFLGRNDASLPHPAIGSVLKVTPSMASRLAALGGRLFLENSGFRRRVDAIRKQWEDGALGDGTDRDEFRFQA
jgi:REP element-mobilizing transposase RayT